MRISYPCEIIKNNFAKYLISFIDFPEIIITDFIQDTALSKARDILTSALEYRMAHNMLIPLPSQKDDAQMIYPSLRVQIALLFRFNNEDGRIPESSRINLEDPSYWSSLRQLDQIANILEKRLVVSFE